MMHEDLNLKKNILFKLISLILFDVAKSTIFIQKSKYTWIFIYIMPLRGMDNFQLYNLRIKFADIDRQPKIDSYRKSLIEIKI